MNAIEPRKVLDTSDRNGVLNIITCISIDTEASDVDAHYPQIPYAKSAARRLIFWKCAMVFFGTSCAVNRTANHYLYTNDPQVPTIEGVDCKQWLADLGVSIVQLPFAIHKPPAGAGHIFRNNFYKLDVAYEASRRHAGTVFLADSDVVWVNALPKCATGQGIYLYPVFESRKRWVREPNGISLDDLDDIFRSLSDVRQSRRTQWIGGELIGGAATELLSFTSMLHDTFKSWCELLGNTTHVFPNGSTVFDNDEILLSFVNSRFGGQVKDAGEFLRRIWTEEHGGGTEADFDLAAWHLPNEKLRGIPLLFDDIFVNQKQIEMLDIGAACGIPIRSRLYVPRSGWQRGRGAVVNTFKAVLPRRFYNVIRKVFGRAPISD